MGGEALLVFRSVEADDGEVGGGIGFAADVGVVFGAEDAVFGGEEGLEGEAGNVLGGLGVEEVDGAVTFGVETGLVGQEPEAEGGVVVGDFGEGGVVAGFGA